MMQRLLEDQCETHHIEGSVLHGKPDFIQTKSLFLNTEKCANLQEKWVPVELGMVHL